MERWNKSIKSEIIRPGVPLSVEDAEHLITQYVQVHNEQRLHSAIYVIGLLALIHFFQQTKAEVAVPTFVAALFGWMMGYRLLIKFKKTRGELPAWKLLALTVAIAVLTFIVEAIGISLAFNVSPLRVLSTALDFDDLSMIRPGWLVLGAGLIVVVLDLVRQRFGPRRGPAAATRA